MVVLVAGACFAGAAQAGRCVAQSEARTVALVELYTSKSCGTCLPAERWLSSLRHHAPGRMLPVVLHVDSRDYAGDRPPGRERKLTLQQRMALTYTPQVLLQGLAYPGWGTPAFEQALAKINALPSQALIRLEIVSLAAASVEVAAAAQLLEPSRARAALYLAAYAELEGKGHAVLQWEGPFALGATPLALRRRLPLLPGALPANSGVVGLVQDRRTADVLQALRLAAC